MEATKRDLTVRSPNQQEAPDTKLRILKDAKMLRAENMTDRNNEIDFVMKSIQEKKNTTRPPDGAFGEGESDIEDTECLFKVQIESLNDKNMVSKDATPVTGTPLSPRL